MQLERILVVKADHHPSASVVAAAAELARRVEGSLTVADLHPDGASISEFFQHEHLRRLRALVPSSALDAARSFRLLAGSLETVLEAVELEFDLILPLGGDDRFVTELLRLSPLPVWVPQATTVPPRRILATLDLDDSDPGKAALNRLVLDTSRRLGDMFDARLEIASVWSPEGVAGRLAGPRRHSGAFKRHATSARARFERTLERATAGGDALDRRPPVHLAGGDPAEMILEVANARDIDLIVAGHAGRKGLPAWLFGNTAEKLVRGTACSLLTVKPPVDVASVEAA